MVQYFDLKPAEIYAFAGFVFLIFGVYVYYMSQYLRDHYSLK